MTDSEESVHRFQKRFKDKLIVWPGFLRTKLSNISSLPMQDSNNLETKERIGLEALLEMLTILKTDAFLHHESSLSRVAWMLEANLKSFTILNANERRWVEGLRSEVVWRKLLPEKWVRKVLQDCVWQREHVILEVSIRLIF